MIRSKIVRLCAGLLQLAVSILVLLDDSLEDLGFFFDTFGRY